MRLALQGLAVLGASLSVAACVAVESEPDRADAGALDALGCSSAEGLGPGVVLASASDPLVMTAPCEWRSFRAHDTIRSADVESHGSGGLVFNPLTGGAENDCDSVGCEDPPCAAECGTGGAYTRVYDAGCPPFEDPNWAELRWDASIPVGTRIVFELRAAHTPDSLDDAVVVRHVVTWSSPAFVRSVGVLLYAAGVTFPMPFLELRAVLESSAALRTTPTLRSFSLETICHSD